MTLDVRFSSASISQPMALHILTSDVNLKQIDIIDFRHRFCLQCPQIPRVYSDTF